MLIPSCPHCHQPHTIPLLEVTADAIAQAISGNWWIAVCPVTRFPFLVAADEQRASKYAEEVCRVGLRPTLHYRAAPFPVSDAVAFACSVPGWMSSDELTWLSEQAREIPPHGTWVEVGVWHGRSYSCVALSLPENATLYGYDHWQGSPGEEESHRDHEAVGMAFFKLRNELKELRPVGLFASMIDSVGASSRWPGASHDVVFLDAGHDAASFAADLAAWLPKVRPGGMICGHDRNLPGVAAGLDDVTPNILRVKPGPGAIWWARIP